MKNRLALGVSLVTLVLASAGCGPEKKVRPAQDTMEQYARLAHARRASAARAPGSLFDQGGPTRDLYGDFKARNLDDTLTILVAESTSALSSADAATATDTSLSSGVSALAGLEGRVAELPNLAAGRGSRKFDGKGSTNRRTLVSTTVSARVVDVLPNGNLLIEGAKEITVNNENQLVLLTGVVRPRDINAGNVVPSTAIANLQVYVSGAGQVTGTLRGGWLYRLLSGLLPL